MKRIKIISVIAVLIIIVSCNKRSIYPNEADYSTVDTIFYDYEEGYIIPRDSAFGSINYITLETNEDNLIGTVDQIILGDSTIIIVDSYIAKAVFMFDYEGNYIGRISNHGNGRNEYIELSYVCQKADKTIALLDEMGGKIMIYDERGNYKKSIMSDIYANAMEFINDDLIAYDIYNRYPKNYDPYDNVSFAVRDKKQNVKYLFGLTDYQHEFNYSRYYNLYSFDNVVYCNVNFDDYIYELGLDSVKAKYRIIYGPENVNNHPYKSKEELYSLQRYYPFFEGEFIELSDYTYLMYRGENGLELLYNHSNKETYALSLGFDNPLCAFFRRPLARFGDNTMVCAISASDVYSSRNVLANRNAPNDQKEKINALFQNIALDSNPVLFFFEVVF